MTLPLVKPRLWLRSGNGFFILSAASRAAGKGGWSHQEWLDFSREVRRMEWEAMFARVCEAFDVTKSPLFSENPDDWLPYESPVDDEPQEAQP